MKNRNNIIIVQKSSLKGIIEAFFRKVAIECSTGTNEKVFFIMKGLLSFYLIWFFVGLVKTDSIEVSPKQKDKSMYIHINDQL